MKTAVVALPVFMMASLLMAGSVAAQDLGTQDVAYDTPSQTELTLCRDDADRDCIEELGLVTEAGFIPGYVVSESLPITWGPIQPGGSESGPTNGTATILNEIWRIPGLRTESGRDTVNPNIAITTPGLRWYASDSGEETDALAVIGLDIFTGRGVDVPATPACEEGTGTCWREENILPNQTLRVVIRTSRFDPAWAFSALGNTTLRIDPLPGGGSRISLQGYALEGPGFFYGGGRKLPHLRDRFDYSWYRWSVHLYDANDARLPDTCTRFGFPLISGNQWGTGIPQWNRRTRELDLVMSAPHRDGDGRVFRGHYEAFIPGDYARCLWKTSPRQLRNRLMVEVTAEDGNEKVATTSIAYRSGGIRVVARNFTFSSPTITVKRKKKFTR